MGISTMLKLLKEKDKGKIILVNIGNFYIASGKDVVLLNNIIGLKLTCLETNICKVGFPLNALEKYTKKTKALEILNEIDANLNTQRTYLRIEIILSIIIKVILKM